LHSHDRHSRNREQLAPILEPDPTKLVVLRAGKAISMEPITGMFSRRSDFDLDGDGATSGDELQAFDALNAHLSNGYPDQFLTFADVQVTQRDFHGHRLRAVERLLAASDLYKARSDNAPRTLRNTFSISADRTRAQHAAQLAHAFAPPGSDAHHRSGVQLRALGVGPARRLLPP
jgi:hypothetical protein